ncbi:MAG: hypothetical protein WAO35_22680 [Terriglobia bacterium]
MLTSLQVQEALANLTEKVNRAYRSFDEWFVTADEYSNPSWSIESCFFQLMAICEALELGELHKLVLSEYGQFKDSKEGFGAAKIGPDEPYSVCLSRIGQYKRAVEAFFPREDQKKVSKDLLQIISDIHYVITDKALYGGPPCNENDVHIRIEGILKCLFPDLKHKPVLNKPIKNFEPDTGISSIGTLIEYKFLDRKENVTSIADQVLADTRGYVSKDWNQFLYIVYETDRFKPQKEWTQLLIQAGVPESTKIIVLSGVSAPRKRK